MDPRHLEPSDGLRQGQSGMRPLLRRDVCRTVSRGAGSSVSVAKTYSGSRPKRTGDLIPATWPPIISEALFYRVQERRKARRLTVTNGGPRARDFTFRG